MKPCKHCKKLHNEEESENFCSDRCEHLYYEKRDKAKRAKLRAAGKWARLCCCCGRGLVKGKCSFAFTHMDGRMDQGSLQCDACTESDDAWHDEQMSHL